MRDILEAKIAALEEHATKLKGLAEMKQRIGETGSTHRSNPERFQQKALEHEQDAKAALLAAATLKVALTKRTKAKQIAVMQHYVLEFGQSASRNAKAASRLDDDDPEKEQVEQRGLRENFVVAVLNGLLSEGCCALVDGGQARSGAQWAASVIALAVLATSLVVAWIENIGVMALVGAVIAAIIWLVGLGLRYVLARS